MKARERYRILDQLRGITLLSMFLYHGIWDLVYLFGWDLPWYHGRGAFVWQQSICWTFLLLSGFCQPFGRKKIRRAALVFGGGALITAVTVLLMPQNRVVFGVLTLLGTCMFLWIGLEKAFSGLSPSIGLAGSAILFFLTRDVNEGWLGFGGLRLALMPEGWYADLFTAWLGFPAPDFYSTDYFSLIPWVFLFAAGYFLNRLAFRRGTPGWLRWGNGADAGRKAGAKTGRGPAERGLAALLAAIAWLGRHSLLLYLLHQPVIYGALWAAARIFGWPEGV